MTDTTTTSALVARAVRLLATKGPEAAVRLLENAARHPVNTTTEVPADQPQAVQ